MYIENFPESSTIETLKKTFSKIGNINYVSLPKFKNSKNNKGYAFIEFEV